MDWIGNEKHCASHLIYFFRFTIYIASDCQAIINSEEYISEKDYYFRFANFTEELKSKILTKEQDKKKKYIMKRAFVYRECFLNEYAA